MKKGSYKRILKDYSDEEEGDEGILLSDMIGRVAPSNPSITEAKKTSNLASDRNNGYSEDSLSYHDDDDDEEDDEDDDDEEEEEDDDENDEDYDSSVLDEEDEEALATQHEKLLNAVQKFSHDQEDIARKREIHKRFMNQAESESANIGTKRLTMNALFGGLDSDSAGRTLTGIKAQLTELENSHSAPVYVEKVASERIERKETYLQNKEEANRWQELVITNRNAPTLDLAQDKRQLPKAKALVRNFVPKTPFEKEIQMVLVESGATEEALAKKESELLVASKLDPEEIKQKQAELAKVKALLFYEQMKRHRINKIKSKAFRAIKRKERQRQKKEDEDVAIDMDAEEAENIREKNAMNRVKERMNLKHKNTSKWAKMALSHGHSNKELRDAYHESVRMGHELTRKMNEEVGGNDGDDDNGELASDTEDVSPDKTILASARRQMEKVLAGEDCEPPVPSGKFRKLFEMDFMKKAAEQQKQRARDEAREVLKEIAEMERGGGEETDEENETKSRENFQGEQTRNNFSEEETAKASAEFSEIFKKQKSFQILPTSKAFVQRGGIKLDDSEEDFAKLNSSMENHPPKEDSKSNGGSEALVNPWLSSSETTKGRTGEKMGVKFKSSTKDQAILSLKPILSSSSNQKDLKASIQIDKALQKGKGIASAESGLASATLDNVKDEAQKEKVNRKRKRKLAAAENASSENPTMPTPTTLSKPSSQSNPKTLTDKTQDDLVRMAFSGPDYEAEFLLHKQQEIDDELGLDEKKMKILKDVKAGWGDWAGPGAMEISPKILAKREKLLVQVQRENDVKRLDRKDSKYSNVMISERRTKKAALYKVSEVPYPYRTKEEYEKSLQMPVGEEWNAMQVVSKMTQPEIKTRSGRIIEPIKAPKKTSS